MQIMVRKPYQLHNCGSTGIETASSILLQQLLKNIMSEILKNMKILKFNNPPCYSVMSASVMSASAGIKLLLKSHSEMPAFEYIKQAAFVISQSAICA